MSRRHGFTLLEIMMAIVIGLLLMSIAVPSVTGLMREQKLKRSFEEFDDFVRTAQTRAVSDGHTFVMVWEESGITLDPLEPAATSDEQKAPEQFSFADGATWTLARPAALMKKPVWEWPFWRSGACEPAIVSYEGPAGTWSAEYNGLTGRGKLVAMEVK
jgi:prepilin-type N-terminal cleavage/methylation domain-containing protein